MTKRKSVLHTIPTRTGAAQWRHYGTRNAPDDGSQAWQEEHELDTALALLQPPKAKSRETRLERNILADYAAHIASGRPASQSDASQGEASQGEASQGEVSQSDASQGEASQGEASQGSRMWFSSGMMAAGFAFGIVCGALLANFLTTDARTPIVAFLEMPIQSNLAELIPQ